MVETVTKMLWDHGGDSDKDAVGLWWRLTKTLWDYGGD